MMIIIIIIIKRASKITGGKRNWEIMSIPVLHKATKQRTILNSAWADLSRPSRYGFWHAHYGRLTDTTLDLKRSIKMHMQQNDTSQQTVW